MSLEANHDTERGGRGRAAVTTIALIGDDAAAYSEILAALAQIPEPLVEVVELTGDNGDARQRPPAIVIVTLGDDEETWALQNSGNPPRGSARRGARSNFRAVGRQGAASVARRRRRRLLSAG